MQLPMKIFDLHGLCPPSSKDHSRVDYTRQGRLYVSRPADYTPRRTPVNSIMPRLARLVKVGVTPTRGAEESSNAKLKKTQPLFSCSRMRKLKRRKR